MNSMMDVMISFIIAGIILMLVLQVDNNVKSSSIFLNQDLQTQENLKVVSDILNFELRKIGHCLHRPERSITIADTARIVFAYNKKRKAVLGIDDADSIRVEFKLSVQDDDTRNPHDKKFIRMVNGQTVNGSSMGLTRMRFRYFNQQGTELSTPVVADSLRKIRSIRVLLGIESREPYKEEYSRFMYLMRITPKNLLGA